MKHNNEVNRMKAHGSRTFHVTILQFWSPFNIANEWKFVPCGKRENTYYHYSDKKKYLVFKKEILESCLVPPGKLGKTMVLWAKNGYFQIYVGILCQWIKSLLFHICFFSFILFDQYIFRAVFTIRHISCFLVEVPFFCLVSLLLCTLFFLPDIKWRIHWNSKAISPSRRLVCKWFWTAIMKLKFTDRFWMDKNVKLTENFVMKLKLKSPLVLCFMHCFNLQLL